MDKNARGKMSFSQLGDGDNFLNREQVEKSQKNENPILKMKTLIEKLCNYDFAI